jgi:hypothetical protein
MPPRRTPKRLRDVSHLFLSKSGSFKFTEERSVEAVVWLAVTGRSLNRAYLASGIGTAFARLGMKVTLLELGEGLPNIGYYFTREPAEYLGATLDGRAVIYGVSESLISYAYAVQPEAFGHIQDTVSFPGYPHLIVVAFLCSDGACNGEWFKRLNGCSSRFSGQGAKVQKGSGR